VSRQPLLPFRRRLARAAEHDRHAREEHLGAQHIALTNRQIRVGIWLNWITGAAVLFAFLSVIGVVWSVLEARRATVEANRAWVGLDGPMTVADFNAGPIWALALRSTLRNYGHGPALKVTSTVFVEDDQKNIDGTAQFVCDAAEHFSTGTVPMASVAINPGPLGHVLFPDQHSAIGDPHDPDQPYV
jgi:hypothetical protein